LICSGMVWSGDGVGSSALSGGGTYIGVSGVLFSVWPRPCF
jgi:hypothetical protein